jgi:hypothetical protein
LPYNVYLLNGLGISAQMNRTTLTSNQVNIITSTLKDYFDQVVKAHDAAKGAKQFGSSSINWISGPTAVADTELLVYLLPFGATVCSKGKLEQGSPPAGHDGLTNPNLGGTGSEVYLHTTEMKVIANLMFHECMHNKLKLGNAGLHSKDGLAAASVDDKTPLTPGNIKDMAGALEKSRPQWTAGIKLITDAAAMDDNDPAKGLF